MVDLCIQTIDFYSSKVLKYCCSCKIVYCYKFYYPWRPFCWKYTRLVSFFKGVFLWVFILNFYFYFQFLQFRGSTYSSFREIYWRKLKKTETTFWRFQKQGFEVSFPKPRFRKRVAKHDFLSVFFSLENWIRKWYQMPSSFLLINKNKKYQKRKEKKKKVDFQIFIALAIKLAVEVHLSRKWNALVDEQKEEYLCGAWILWADLFC